MRVPVEHPGAGERPRRGALAGLMSLIGWFVSVLISMGLIRIALKIVDGKPIEIAPPTE